MENNRRDIALINGYVGTIETTERDKKGVYIVRIDIPFNVINESIAMESVTNGIEYKEGEDGK